MAAIEHENTNYHVAFSSTPSTPSLLEESNTGELHNMYRKVFMI
jgi:hypothetical protein